MLEPMPTLGWSALLATLGYLGAERFFRLRWRTHRPTAAGPDSPYRATELVVETASRAPRVVRAAAFTGILLGGIAAPGITCAIETLQSDGIGVSLWPPVACAVAVGIAGCLLLARAPAAADVARTASVATIAAHALVVALAAIHVLAARLQWSDRASLAYVAVACCFALIAVPQAALMQLAVARLRDPNCAGRTR